MNSRSIAKNKREIIILAGICLIHIVFMYIISSFAKRPETYRDELIYLGAARGIAEGTAFTVHAVPISLTNVLYSLILAPEFLIADTILRTKAITLINCILVSLTIIPVYYICKELKVKKTYTWIMLGILFFWPDMTIAATFMPENLYFPLVALALLASIKAFEGDNLIISALAGMTTYFVFNCKEVGLCIFLAHISVEILSPIVCQKSESRVRITRIKNMRYCHVLVYTAVFLILYVGFKLIFLRNMVNVYAEAGVVSMELLKDHYTILYLVYSCVYYFMSCLLAFFVLPIVVPAIRFDKMHEYQKKAYLLGILSLIYTIGVIGIMITIKESFGNDVPTVHLRYIFPLICILFPVFFSTMSTQERAIGEKYKEYWTWLLISIVGLLVFKGHRIGSTTSGLSLMYSYYLAQFIPDITGTIPEHVVFYPSAYLITVFVSVIMFIYLRNRKRISRNVAVYIFGGVTLTVCLINFCLSNKNIRNTYGADSTDVLEMNRINSYFAQNEWEDKSVMFVGGGLFTSNTKIYDMYFDAAGDEMEISFDDLVGVVSTEDYSGNLADATFILPIWDYEYHTQTIDYFIVGDGFWQRMEDEFIGLEKVTELSTGEFSVYRNINNKTLNLK